MVNIKKKSYIMEWLQALLLIFCFLFGTGNYNLYYLYGAILTIYAILFDRRLIIKSIFYLIPFVVIALVASILSPLFSSYEKMFITLIKIYINLLVMVQISFRINKFNINKFIDISINLFCIATIIAIIFKNSTLLWALNDRVNKFRLVRLKLFYLEPSLVALCVSMLIILVIYQCIKSGVSKKNVYQLIILFLDLFLSAGLNGIICLAVSLSVMFILVNSAWLMKGKIIPITVIAMPLIIVAIIMFLKSSDSYVLQRIEAMKDGNDGSYNYRVELSLITLPILFSETKGFGVGLGNLNTDNVMNYLPAIYSNSFMYFIAETGIPGGILLIIIIIKLFRTATKSKERDLKVPLLIFILMYQVGGGYFTNTWIWMIYGLINAQNIFKEEYFRNNKVVLEKGDLA